MDITTKIRPIAEKIRRGFEEIARRENSFRNLCGFCGRASVQMWLECQRQNIHKVRIASSTYHAFCLYSESNGSLWVADVTATQFGENYPRILLMHFPTLLAFYKNARHHSLHKVWNSIKEVFEADNLFGASSLWERDMHTLKEIWADVDVGGFPDIDIGAP